MDEPRVRTVDPNAPKSEQYREGYREYQRWRWSNGDKPSNPYWTGAEDGESRSYHDWQSGFEDASFDE